MTCTFNGDHLVLVEMHTGGALAAEISRTAILATAMTAVTNLSVSTYEQYAENQRLEIKQAATKSIMRSLTRDQRFYGRPTASVQALLDSIGEGERLIVTKLDRLGRDVQDIGNTIKATGGELGMAARPAGCC